MVNSIKNSEGLNILEIWINHKCRGGIPNFSISDKYIITRPGACISETQKTKTQNMLEDAMAWATKYINALGAAVFTFLILIRAVNINLLSSRASQRPKNDLEDSPNIKDTSTMAAKASENFCVFIRLNLIII